MSENIELSICLRNNGIYLELREAEKLAGSAVIVHKITLAAVELDWLLEE